jgi:hypothetical protein
MFGSSKEKQLTEYANKVLADDILTEDEQHQFLEFAETIGVNLNQYPAILNRIVIANANAGRFPQAVTPFHIMCKPGEEVYLEAQSSLLKEVADRQWQGGSSGFSFRIAKGVRYRVGNTRGHMQQVGTKLIVKDTGILSVTSTRLVFSGSSTTQESQYSKIVNLTVFNDGLAVAVSKGQDTVTRSYSTSAAEMIAAVINAAMQPHVGASSPKIVEPGTVGNVGLMSEDGKWRWDGAAWQHAEDQELLPPVSNVGLMSADGKWRWDGAGWQPVELGPPPVPE